MSENVYDLDAIVAEELGELPPIEFSIGGETFTIPAIREWSDDVLDALLHSDIVAVTRGLLGKDADRFKAAGGNSQKMFLLVTRLTKEQGATTPESSASTDS